MKYMSLRKYYWHIIGILVIILSAGYIFLVHTVMPKYIRQMLPVIEAMAPDYINGTVSIGDLTWDGGLSAEIIDVTVKDNAGGKIAVLPRTVVSVRPWLAIGNAARALSKLELVRPQVYLTMNDKERWNMQDLLKPSDSDETPFYGLLEVTDGTLEITMPEGQWDFGVNGKVNGGANPKFAVDVTVKSGLDELAASGLVTAKGEGQIEVKTDKLDLAPYAALAEHYGGIKKLTGGISDVVLLYVNENGKMTYSGKATFDSLKGSVMSGDTEHKLCLEGQVKSDANIVRTDSLVLTADGQQLKLAAMADLRDTDAPSGEGIITSDKLAYGGYTVTNLRLPVKGDKKTVQITDMSGEYGGGKVLINAAYALEEKKLTADVELAGITQPLTGANELNVNGRFAVVADTNEDNIEIHAGADTFALELGTLRIEQMDFDGSYSDKGLKVDHLSIFAGANGSFAAKGTIGSDGALALEGRMSDFPIYPVLALAGQDGTGYCSTGFKVGGSLSAPEFGGMLQFTKVEVMNQKVKEAHGIVNMKDNVLSFRNFHANMHQGEHLLNGSIDLRGSEPVFDLVLETTNVRIEPLAGLAAPGVSITGNLDNIVDVQGSLSHPYVYGEIHASDGSAVGQLFSAIDGRYKYEDGKVSLEDFIVRAFYATLSLNGTMSAKQELDFAMEATDVDLAHLPIEDETVELGGQINALGRLNGTLASPYFNGEINASAITINGEKLTDLKGTVKADGQDNNTFDLAFKQPYKDDAFNYGRYVANLNLNIPAKYLHGKVEMFGGDIGGLLRMGRMDYDIKGQLQGSLEFSPEGKGSGIVVKVTSDDVKIHDLKYEHLDFAGSLRNKVWKFDDVKLQEFKGVMDKGIIGIGGYVDLAKEEFRLGVGSAKANPAIITAVMKDPPEIKGETDMLIKVSGTYDNPAGGGYVKIYNGSIAGVELDSLSVDLTLADDNIKLQQLSGIKDAYSVQASGDIPLDVFRSKEQRRNPQAQMNINVDLDQARLGILPAMTNMVEWGEGDTHGKIRIAGTLEEPLLYGDVKIAGGRVKVKYLDTILENICLDVNFEGNQVLLNDLSTGLGKGKLSAQGSYALNTGVDTAYSLKVKADNVELVSPILHGLINSDIEIVPERYREFPKPGSEPPKGPPPVKYRPKIMGKVRLDDIRVNMPTIPAMGEGESNYGMDLAIELGPKIHLLNSYFYDIWLGGGIAIRGSTAFPIVEGSIKALKGTISYLRTDFKLSKANLVWVEPGSFLPNVSLESRARFSRYYIFMNINGPVMAMDLQLTSDPPLEKNTIIRMLTLQRDSAGSNEVTSEDVDNLMNAGLQMTVLGDVEMWVKQTLGLDQFRLYTGKVHSGVGIESSKDRNQQLTDDEKEQYNVLVSKYLNDRFMLGYTTSFNAVDKSIFGQYDINRRVSINYSRTYDLSNDTENWYGLEYRVGF